MKNFIAIFVLSLGLATFSSTFAQEWQSYTWEKYSTKFKIPTDFEVTESTGDKFEASNNVINLTIYPFKYEYKTYEAMETGLTDWAEKSKVSYNKNEELIQLDETKMNGYWGMLLEGTKDDFPVGMLLIADPDYPDITLYIWVSYYEDQVDIVLEMLMSFTPM